MTARLATTPTHAYLRDFFNANEANVDGSVEAKAFTWTAPSHHYVYSLLAYIEDGATFDANLYGALVALTNGTSIDLNGSDPLDGETIKTNADLLAAGFTFEYHDIGTGDSMLAARLDLTASGNPLKVLQGETVTVTVSDDLTALTSHRFMVQGRQQLQGWL